MSNRQLVMRKIHPTVNLNQNLKANKTATAKGPVPEQFFVNTHCPYFYKKAKFFTTNGHWKEETATYNSKVNICFNKIYSNQTTNSRANSVSTVETENGKYKQ